MLGLLMYECIMYVYNSLFFCISVYFILLFNGIKKYIEIEIKCILIMYLEKKDLMN